MSISLDLDGQIAVVTGAASGIGRAVAITLAQAGATVAAVDRNANGVRATVEQIGGASTAHTAELTDPAAIHSLRDDVLTAQRAPTSWFADRTAAKIINIASDAGRVGTPARRSTPAPRAV